MYYTFLFLMFPSFPVNTTVAPFPVLAHLSTSRYSTDTQCHPHYATHKWDFRGLHRACLQWLKPLMFKCMYFKWSAVMSDINNGTENGLEGNTNILI